MKHKLTLEDYGFIKRKRVEQNCEIDKLPTELMVIIFKMLTPSQRRNIITVSHRWLKIVNTFFQQDHCLTITDTIDYSPFGSLYQTFHNRLTSTKHLRTFTDLIIESFPGPLVLEYFLKFLELIGNEVKSIQIKDESHDLNSDFMEAFNAKFSNIETMEGNCDYFPYFLSSDTTLRTIKSSSSVDDIGILMRCREITSIKSFTVFKVFVELQTLKNQVCFIETDTINALTSIFSDCGALAFKSNFNYCGEEKMSLTDLEGIHIYDCVTSLSPNTFEQFENLKELSFESCSDESLISITEVGNYSKINQLTIIGEHKFPFEHFKKFVQSFINLKHLKFEDFDLDEQDFSTICQYLPNLKELIFDEDCSKISVRELFAEDTYSLKNLKLLEKLVIHTKDEIIDVSDIEWPSLPNLKDLSLTGNSFQHFNQDFYSQIALKSPKITKVTVDYYFPNFPDFRKFIPLLRDLKVTHLTLPGLNNRSTSNFDEANTSLINIMHYSTALKVFTFKDEAGFSTSEKRLLFKSVPSLQTIVLQKEWGEFKTMRSQLIK